MPIDIVLTGPNFTSKCHFLGLCPRLEIFEARPQVDVVLLLRAVVLVPAGPVVAHGVGKNLEEETKKYGIVFFLTVMSRKTMAGWFKSI